jgi:hypothetical protein
MAYVVRTWNCQNTACGKIFDHGDPNPACPKCGCVRVAWQPAGGHVGGVSKGADDELRKLADVFRMNDMHSAERGRAAKKVAAPIAAARGSLNFAPGFSAAFSAEPTCQPSATRVDFKVKPSVGRKLSGQMGFGSIVAGTQIEAAHRPKS